MAYIGRMFRKIEERINRVFHKHEPVQDYRIEEPGYVPIVKAERPRVRETGAGSPAFDPKARIYKPVKLGAAKPRVGQRHRPKADYLASDLKRISKRKKKKREEYLEPAIIELKKEIEDKEEEIIELKRKMEKKKKAA